MHPFVRGHHAPHSSDPLLKKRLKRRDAPAPCVPAALDCASDLAFRLRSDPVSGPCVPALCLDPALGCLRSGCVPALRPGACVPTALPTYARACVPTAFPPRVSRRSRPVRASNAPRAAAQKRALRRVRGCGIMSFAFGAAGGMKCGRGGIGRRVRFRSVWGQPHGGSSSRTAILLS